MKINSSVNSIKFGSNKNFEKVNKKTVSAKNTDTENFAITPEYNVKTPQKYKKLETASLPANLKAHIYKLENGQKVVIIPKDGPTIIKTYVNTGALNEKDDERGISHFVEHSLFNGSDGLNAGEFFDVVNKMGANTNASTGFSATDYYIKSNLLKDSDLEKQIKIHASMIESPKFTPEMIEKEKGPVTSEISMILDDTENIAINNTIKNLFNIKSSSTDIIGGTIDNINNLTRDKVLAYYKQNYYPSNMVTVISGDVNEKETMNLVSKYMQSKAKEAANRKFEDIKPIDKTVREDIVSDKASSGFISIGLKGPQNNNHKDQVIFDAINYILTSSTLSRINKSLEEIQSEASANIERVSSKQSDSTAILIAAKVDDKNSETALNKINKALEALKTNPPTDEELNFIKKNLKFDFLSRFERSSDINSMIGGAMLDDGLNGIENYEKYIDELTPQDFVEFGTKYLDTSKESVTVIHPKQNKISFSGKNPINTKNIEITTLPNNIKLLENNIDKNIVYADFKLSSNIQPDTKAGASIILSALLERGTKDLSKDDFYTQAEKNGIMLGFSASDNSLSASAKFMKQDAYTAIQNIKQVLNNPRFAQEDFEEVKKQLIQDLKNTPKTAKEALYKEIFKGQIKGISNKELLQSIVETKLEDVVDLHNKIINNAQFNVAISGPFKDENFKNAVEKELSAFSQFKKSEITDKASFKPIEKTKVITQTHNKSQAEIISAYKFKINDNSPEKMVRYSLLNIILGGTSSSRLFNDLRESQKLAYHVKSYLDYNDDDTGICNLYIKTTTDNKNNYNNIEKSINGFNSHVSRILEEEVSQEELENAKLIFKNRLLNDNETTGDKNATLLTNMQKKFGIELTNNVMNIIDSITPEDIQNAAKEMFSTPAIYSIVAKKEALDKNEKYLNDLFL